MSVHDAEPSDIYTDKYGKLWRCIGICREPTVTFEEVEGRTIAPSQSNQMAQGTLASYAPSAPPIIRDRKNGGVGGLMWDGWTRIWRKPAND